MNIIRYILLFTIPAAGSLCLLALYNYYHAYGIKKELSRPFVVCCTTNMIADAVTSIGGIYTKVIPLMGPGVDPHVYKAREYDVRNLISADLVLYHGLHLEGKMVSMLANLQNYVPSIAVTNGIPRDQLISVGCSEGLYDPHVWHDVILWKMVVTYIGELLAHFDTRHASYYHNQTLLYCLQLTKLDNFIRGSLQSLPASKRILVTAHDAFSYFGRTYGFTIIGLQGISTESEVSIQDIRIIADTIVEKKIKALFFESSIPQRTIQALRGAVKARGWDVRTGGELFSDTLDSPTHYAGTYCGMMRHNTTTIAHGLRV